MAKSVNFVVNNSKVFTSYLKKFASVDNSVLFELDLEEGKFLAKSPNEERSIVKYAALSFVDAGFETKSNLKIRIKIGIYNISRLIKIIDQFGDKFEFVIKYDEIIGNNEQKDYAALSILLSNNDLKFSNECTSLNIFKYISDDLYNNTIRKLDEIISFHFSKEIIERIRAFSELDKEYKFLEFCNKSGKLFAKGKSFEYLVAPTTSENVKIPIYKEQFDKVDIENYNVSIGSDRMLFTSNDTSTEIVISKVEINEDYEEVSKDQFE